MIQYPIIVGISAKKQGGKSSLCNYLQAWLYRECLLGNKKAKWSLTQLEDDSVIITDEYGKINDGGYIVIEGKVYSGYHRPGPVYFPDKKQQIDAPGTVYSFADILKTEVCMNTLGLIREQVYGTDAQKNSETMYRWDNLPIEIREKYSVEETELDSSYAYQNQSIPEGTAMCPVPRTGAMTGREVMQIVGTDIFRNMLDDSVWVNATLSHIEKDYKYNSRLATAFAFIADVRFKSEVNAIIDQGGYIIRLTKKVSGDNHPSEIDLDDYDFESAPRTCVIDNSKMTIDEKNVSVIDHFSKIVDEENTKKLNEV